MGTELAKELAALHRLPLGRLRDKYAEVFGEPPSGNSRPWLVRGIAWRLQERALGGLTERAKARAAELADDADLRVVPPRTATVLAVPRSTSEMSPSADPRLPAPGTVRSRPYKGEMLEVKVLADGFEFAGNRYGSLSAVAKAATGSHCNGFAFFGLAKGDKS
jgi:Protein of unknown function (DUF2924)